MKLSIKDKEQNQSFSLVYHEDEHAFDIDPNDEDDFTSLLINDLQIEINDQGKLLYAWGYCPLINFEKTSHTPKNYFSRDLFILEARDLTPGISRRINQDERWPVFVNEEEGWVCIGNPDCQIFDFIGFAPGCVISLLDNEIKAIWLKPTKLPKLI